MTPTRRELLAAGGLFTGGALAGCLGAGGADGRTQTPTPTPEPVTDGGLPDDDGDDDSGTRPSGTGGPAVSIVRVDDPPALPVVPAVEVLTAAATESTPPVLRVTLTNDGDTPVTVGGGRAVRFQYVVDESRDLQLLPVGDGESYPVPDGNCWRLEEGIATTEEYRTEELAPGATIEGVVGLFGLPSGDGCLPVGGFRFVTTVAVDPFGETERAASRFDLTLE
jgi:hypothetical protein